MGNPLVQLGALNRIRASLTFNDHPELNVTASFLGKSGVSMSLDGALTQQLEQMTGAVQSQEPYVPVTITVDLVRTTSLAKAFKDQIEVSTLLGDLTLRPDTAALGNYPVSNCAIDNQRELAMNGTSASFPLVIKGYYSINSSLFDS